jgi:hypothetical protein
LPQEVRGGSTRNRRGRRPLRIRKVVNGMKTVLTIVLAVIGVAIALKLLLFALGLVGFLVGLGVKLIMLALLIGALIFVVGLVRRMMTRV